MESTRAYGDRLPDAAKDIRLNLQAVLGEGSLTERQRFGVALACAIACRAPLLRDALVADAGDHLDEAAIEDAQAASAIMAMTNVYYRFRHMVGKPSYASMPARLRMQRLAQPRTSKVDFELACLAVSAIHGCEVCVRSHEATLLAAGVTEAQVHDAVRIAAVVHAASVAADAVAADATGF